jgi:hypothetical protein
VTFAVSGVPHVERRQAAIFLEQVAAAGGLVTEIVAAERRRAIVHRLREGV